MFDPRMFYTAISRAKTIDQIYIVKDTPPPKKDLTEKEKEANQKKGEKAYADMVAILQKKGEKAYADMVARLNKRNEK